MKEGTPPDKSMTESDDKDAKESSGRSGTGPSDEPNKASAKKASAKKASAKKASAKKALADIGAKLRSARKRSGSGLPIPRPNTGADGDDDASEQNPFSRNKTAALPKMSGAAEDDAPRRKRRGTALGAPGPTDSAASEVDRAAVNDDVPVTEEVVVDEDDLVDFAAESTMIADSPFESSTDPNQSAPGEFADEDFAAEHTVVSQGAAAEVAAEDSEGAGQAGAEEIAFLDDAELVELDEADAAATTVEPPSSLAEATSPDPPDALRARASQPARRPGEDRNPPTPEQSGSRSGQYNFASGAGRTQDPGSAASPVASPASPPADDLDDDFAAEKTEVIDSPFETDALVPKLSVVRGPAAGREFLLNKLRHTVGRGDANSIVVGDQSMSRQHIEIVKNPDETYTVRDLQSANGTRVNGMTVAEAELYHGDVIELGRTRLKFLVPGEPERPAAARHLVPADVRTVTRRASASPMETLSDGRAETTSRFATYVIVIAGIMSLLLIGPVIYLFVNRPEPAAAVPAEPDQRSATIKRLYLDGVEAVKDRQWDRARSIFEQVQALDASFPGVDAQLARIEREKAAHQSLEAAREQIAGGDGAGALAVLETIGTDSVYHDQAQLLARKQRQAEVRQAFEQAQQAAADGDTEAAVAQLEALLERVPNHESALALRAKLAEDAEEAEVVAEAEPADEPRRQARPVTKQDSWLLDDSGGASDDDGASGGGGGGGGGGGRAVNFTRGFTLYKGGKFDAARRHFEEAAAGGGALARRAARTAEAIGRFESAWRSGNRALATGDADAAIAKLQDAKRADKAVASAGFYRKEVDAKIAHAYGQAGLADFGRGDYAAAGAHLKKGLGYGRSGALRQLSRKLSNKATSLYIQAANKRKTDPAKAAALARQILAMVPPSNPNHKKAKQLLAEL